jgi:glycosyltransferase involved in cell wall biosynthesis
MKSVSILIPTLNSERVLDRCLDSIAAQAYPRDQIEIVIADGGSADATLRIAQRYTDKIYTNPGKTGEAGKAVALAHAQGDIVAFIDSDNILPQTDWLTRMIAPFEDGEIVGAEPLEYTWRGQDAALVRYGALMGMGDPLCLFLGNYDRCNILTGKWTEMPVSADDCGDWIKITVDQDKLPTIGANGFLVRRAALANCSVKEYVFDVDVVHQLLEQGPCKFAKVKIGIVHLFSADLRTLARKQLRRITDYSFYSRSNQRKYPWKGLNRWGLAKFILYCLTVFPLLTQSLVGYYRKRDAAIFLHPIACWITLVTYSYGTLRGLVVQKAHDRTTWGQ